MNSKMIQGSLYARLLPFLAGGAVFLLSIGAQWLVYEKLLDDPGDMRMIGSVLAAIVTGFAVARFQSIARDSRNAEIHRARIIADMNHHIRNALQVLAYQAYASAPEETNRIRDAVNRIDWALREVLPGIELRGNLDANVETRQPVPKTQAHR